MKPSFHNRLFVRQFATGLTSVILFSGAVQGAEISYKVTGSSTAEATTAINWVGDVAPGAADIASWLTDTDGVAAGNQESRGGIITVVSPVSWLGLRAEDAMETLTLTGAPITLGASGITEVRWEFLNLQNNIVLAADQTWNIGNLTTVTGAVSGSGALTKGSTSVLTLGGSNTFTGALAVQNGALRMSSISATGGAISLGSEGTQGILIYDGPEIATSRVLNLSGAAGGATITRDGTGLLSFTAPSTVTGSGAKGVTLNGGGDGQLTGILSNGGLTNLTKAGAGIWTLTGASSHGGGTVNVNAGILAYTATANSTGSKFARPFAGGGALRISPGSSVITTSVNTNGILGGWATYGDSTWAVANGTNAISGLATFTTDVWAAGNNTDVTVDGLDPATSETTNSLRFNAAGAKFLDLAGTNVISSGGILVTANVGNNPTSITGGALVTGSAGGDFSISQYNTAETLTIGSVIGLPAQSLVSATTTGSTTVTVPTTADLSVGMGVTGTGIPANTGVASIVNGTTVTLSAAATGTATPTLAFSTNNGLTFSGPGTTLLTGANTYIGTTNILRGTLEVREKGPGVANYILGKNATLRFGYNVAQTYTHGVTVNGNGLAATTGLYLQGGRDINFQNNGGITLNNAPTTIRTYGTGNAILSGYDTNGTHLTVNASASGSSFDPTIDITGGSFGYVVNIAPGANTATADVAINGLLTGTKTFNKKGAGSLLLTGASTSTGPLSVWAGSVALGGGDDRLAATSVVALGTPGTSSVTGTVSGRLALNGISQTVANLTLNDFNTGTANRVVGGSATLSILNVNYTDAAAGQTFAGLLGGPGPNENNIAFGKNGVGTYTLTGANTYTGGTRVNAGILGLGSAGALGTSGVISMNGGRLQFSAANAVDYSARLRLADAIVSEFDTNGVDVTLASPLGVGSLGTGGLSKLGAGILTLGGNNTYTGVTRVLAGTLRLDYSVVNGSKLADASILDLSGGTLDLAGGSHLEIVAATTLKGSTPVTITRSSGTARISLGEISRTGSATLDVAGNGIVTTTTPNDSSGRLPSWITVNGQPASNDGSGNLVSYSGYVDIVRLGGKIPNNPAANVRIVDGGTTGTVTPLATGTTAISSLLQGATAGPAVVALGDSDLLRLGATGTVLVPAGSAALTIQGGDLTAGGAANTNGEITVDNSAAVTISSLIADNGSGLVTLSKSSAGPLTLSQSNLFSGGFRLANGELRIGHPEALGLGSLIINGGSLDNTSGTAMEIVDALPQTWNADIHFTGTQDLKFAASEVTLTGNRTVAVDKGILSFGGPINGAFGLTKTGVGTLVVGSGTWTGATAVNAGTLEVRAKTGDVPYSVAQAATLRIGYSTGGGYTATNLKLNGDGIAATTGLYLKGGTTYNGSGGIELLTQPTTIRQYSTGEADAGLAAIGMFDINADGLTTVPASSGSVIDSNVQLVSGGYGMSVNVAVGAATATGDLVVNGPLNVGSLGLYKRGAGSLALNGTATGTSAGLKIQGGTVFTGVANAIGANADLIISAGAKLVLNGHSQPVGNLSGDGQLVNTSATPAVVTVKQLLAQTFAGTLGGAGVNDGNFSLVKTGVGVLTINGTANNYTGSTTVAAGTLALATPTLADGAAVLITTGATLQLDTGATDTVASLSVDGAPELPGVYGSMSSAAQFKRSYLTGNGTLTVLSGSAGNAYAAFETLNGIVGAGAQTDSDNDGIPNGIEFVIGGDPSGPDSNSNSLLSAPVIDGTYLTYVFRRTAESAAYNPFVETSPTLAGWTPAVAGVGGVLITTESVAGVDLVTVKIPRTGTALFARLRIVIP